MTMLVKSNIKMAFVSIRGRRWRSFLTILGIIIGISSVVTIVSIGEGIKQQIFGQINHLGANLITIRSGDIAPSGSASGALGSLYLFGSPSSGSSSLTTNDFSLIRNTNGVKSATVMGVVTGKITTSGLLAENSLILGSSTSAPQVLNQSLQYGSFFDSESQYQNVVVLGQNIASQLFPGQVPLGYSIIIDGQQFIVRGVFNKFDTSPLSLDTNFNDAAFIPYPVAQGLENQKAPIYEILAKPKASVAVVSVVNSIRRELGKSHNGASDFSVLKQSDNLKIAGNILNLLTGLIAIIASISLLVAGIGTMNVMLVSVSERTSEIGVRKALGATNRQILNQFLTEAVILSFIGGALGIGVSLFVNLVLRFTTSLQPTVSWQTVGLATLISVLIGIIFGITPAAKAARKNPIDALRYQ